MNLIRILNIFKKKIVEFILLIIAICDKLHSHVKFTIFDILETLQETT